MVSFMLCVFYYNKENITVFSKTVCINTKQGRARGRIQEATPAS